MGTLAAAKAKTDELGRWAELSGEILSKRTFGEDGPDLNTSLADLEQLLGPLLEQFAAGFLRGSISQQAERLADEVPCPTCGQGCVLQTAAEPRRITTEHGDMRWRERSCFCDRCERSFFPATDGFED